MKSFIEHINEEELLDKKPKEAVDEAATMGDLLIGLGAAGGLMALKKGWDAFGKGSKLARGLAFTQKQKAKVAKDAETKRKGKVDDSQAILDDPKASEKDKAKAQKTLDKHQTSAEKDKAIVDKDKEDQLAKSAKDDAKAITGKQAQDKFDQSRQKFGADAQPPKGYSLDPDDKSGKTIIPTADAKKKKAERQKALDKKITAKDPTTVVKKKKVTKRDVGAKYGQAKKNQSKKSKEKARRKELIKKQRDKEMGVTDQFIPDCISILSDLTEDFTKEDRTQLLEELVLEETMTLQESEELQAIMALDDAKIKADINRKGQVVVKKKDLKKAEKILKKEFSGKFKTLMPKLVGEHKGTEPHKHPHEDEELEEKALSGKEVAKRMLKYKDKGGHNYLKGFAKDVAKMKTVSRDDLEKLFPDYVSGGDITKLLEGVLEDGTNAIINQYRKVTPGQQRTAWEVVSKARAKIIEAVDAEAARELYLFMQNERSLMRQRDSIIKNISRKMKSGKYDHKQAPKLWMYWVDNGAKEYDNLYGSPGVKTFDKDTKMSVAIQLADEMKAEIELGNYS